MSYILSGIVPMPNPQELTDYNEFFDQKVVKHTERNDTKTEYLEGLRSEIV